MNPDSQVDPNSKLSFKCRRKSDSAEFVFSYRCLKIIICAREDTSLIRDTASTPSVCAQLPRPPHTAPLSLQQIPGAGPVQMATTPCLTTLLIRKGKRDFLFSFHNSWMNYQLSVHICGVAARVQRGFVEADHNYSLMKDIESV